MQQAVPQHRPSSVPQQQVVREVVAAGVPDRNDCAETGVQTDATLVLIASKAAMTARIGFAVCMTVWLYGTNLRQVQ
jgi:hypothetical protein